MIQLRKACCHFAATGTGCRYHHDFAGSFNVVVFSEPLFRHNVRHVEGIAFDRIVTVHLYAVIFQPAFEVDGGNVFPRKLRYHNAADKKSTGGKFVVKAKHVFVVGYAQIGTQLVVGNVHGVYYNYHFNFVLDFGQHFHLGVGFESRQHPGCVVVVKQFSAEFQIKFSAEFLHTLGNVLRLQPDVLFVVKTFHSSSSQKGKSFLCKK